MAWNLKTRVEARQGKYSEVCERVRIGCGDPLAEEALPAGSWMLPPAVSKVVREGSGTKCALWIYCPLARQAFGGVVTMGAKVGENERSALDHFYAFLRRFFVRPEAASKAERAQAPASPDAIDVLASSVCGETLRMMRVLCTGVSQLLPGADRKPQLISWAAAQMVFSGCFPTVPTALRRYVSRTLVVYHRQPRTVRDCLVALGISSCEGTFTTDLRGVYHSNDSSDIGATLTSEDVLLFLSDNHHARGGRKGVNFLHMTHRMWKVIPAAVTFPTPTPETPHRNLNSWESNQCNLNSWKSNPLSPGPQTQNL